MEITGERFIPGMDGQIELEHYNRYYFVINQLHLSDKVVLDIASGEGYGSFLMARNAKYVYGVDISKETIQHASNNYKSNNLKFILGSTDNIPLDDDSIDVCVSFETIEHHEKHLEMISEIKRVLKKNGVLFISSPDKLNYSDIPKYVNPYHLKELYYDEFKTLVEKHFTKSLFFGQRYFNGSIIAFDNNYKNFKKPLVIDRGGNSGEFIPVYNIAIATDDETYDINHLLVLYTGNEKVYYSSDIQIEKGKAQKLVYDSLSYRLGSYFVKPIKKIKSIFKSNKKECSK